MFTEQKSSNSDVEEVSTNEIQSEGSSYQCEIGQDIVVTPDSFFPTIEMCLAGGKAYENWLSDSRDQAQSNKVGNLVARVYSEMRGLEPQQH